MDTARPIRTSLPLLAIATIAVSLVLAGCSSPGGGGVGESAAGDFPVSIDTSFGTTVIPSRPDRVITLIDDEFVLALGVEPVALSRYGFSESGFSPIVEPLIEGEPTLIDVSGGIPYEQIASLEPDLIVGGVTQEDYDQLARIAPTLPYVGSSNTDTWQDRQLTVGIALGLEAEARELIADTEAAIEEVAAAHPELKDSTFSLSLSFEPGVVSVIRSPGEPIVSLFGRLGLSLAPGSLGLDASDLSGRTTLGLESLDLLAADLIFIAALDDGLMAQIADNPALAASSNGRVVELPVDLVFSLVRPSTLNAVPGLLRILSAIDGG